MIVSREINFVAIRDDSKLCSVYLSFVVQKNGDVAYFNGVKEYFIDRGTCVEMIEQSDEAIEAGLMLALQKFGYKLSLTGPQDFIEKALFIAAKRKITVVFDNENQKEIFQKFKMQLAAENLVISDSDPHDEHDITKIIALHKTTIFPK